MLAVFPSGGQLKEHSKNAPGLFLPLCPERKPLRDSRERVTGKLLLQLLLVLQRGLLWQPLVHCGRAQGGHPAARADAPARRKEENGESDLRLPGGVS